MEILPLVLLDTFRDFSFSQPYLRRNSPFNFGRIGVDKETRTIDLILALDEAQLSDIHKMNVPGLYSAITAMQYSPENFWIRKPHDNFGRPLESTYEQFASGLEQMAIHYLGGDIVYQYLSTELLYRLPEKRLPETLDALSESLKNSKYSPVRRSAIKVLELMVSRSSTTAARYLIEAYPAVDRRSQEMIKKIAPYILLSGLNTADENLPLRSLGEITEIPAEELMDFLQFMKTNGVEHLSLGNTEDLKSIAILGRNQGIRSLISRLTAFGYSYFSSQHTPFLYEALDSENMISRDLQEIRRIFPDFKYAFLWGSVSETKNYQPGSKFEYSHLYQPYEVLVGKTDIKVLIESIYDYLKNGGDVTQSISEGLFKSFRRLWETGTIVASHSWKKDVQNDNEGAAIFHKKLSEMIYAICDPLGQLYQHKALFLTYNVFAYAANHPDRIDDFIQLPSTNPQFFQLLTEGGPLHSNAQLVINRVLESDNPFAGVREIEALFSKPVPIWKKLYMFTHTKLKDRLEHSTINYPVTSIGRIPVEKIIQQHLELKEVNSGRLTRLESMLDDPSQISKIIHDKYIPFNLLKGGFKRLVFRDYLRRSIEITNDSQAKSAADIRNRQLASKNLDLDENTYIHGSAIDYLGLVLSRGNLCGEALGEKASADSYAFYVDFSVADKEKRDIRAKILNSISGGFGMNGKYSSNGQIFYLYDRSKGGFDSDVRYSINESHKLVLGGMPATEITGIVLKDPDTTYNMAVREILEGGFYIPVYDVQGSLLFEPAEFDRLFSNGNFQIPIDTWDYSLKTGGQLGSNPGGQFTVSTQEGMKAFYVKFAHDESEDHLWNEQLADNIYRFLGLSVPYTKIVKVENAFGHASEILPVDNLINMSDLKNGFVFDALLANWDIVANSTNVISSNGRIIRIDNGGSLLFRAQGERKQVFGSVVTELNTMKNGYPGLTQADIQDQLAILREKFTDAAIYNLVDSVRLRTEDRETLKSILRQRRDYILNYFSKTEQETSAEIPAQGRAVELLLGAPEINDTALAQLIRQWPRLIGEEGHQHNGILLGEHLKNAVVILKNLPEYQLLSNREKNLALVAMLFHDIGKPTGKRDQTVVRDFDHEVPSAQIAAEYMQKWGYSSHEIKIITQVIMYDGIVSDIARGKVRDERKNFTPEQLFLAVEGNPEVIRILRAVNHSDVIATVQESGYIAIKDRYESYFDTMITLLN